VDAIQAKMKNAMFRDGIDAQASQRAAAVSGGFATPVYKYRTANENDRFRVEVNGKAFNMSMKEAKEKFDELSSEEAALARVQTQLKDLYEQKKKLTEKDNADIKRLQKEAAEIKSQIALKEKYGPALAEGGKRMVHGHLTALQQIGAYAPNATLIDVNKKIHHEIKGLRGDLKGALGNRGRDFGKARF
jgi:gas vesicle protein